MKVQSFPSFLELECSMPSNSYTKSSVYTLPGAPLYTPPPSPVFSLKDETETQQRPSLTSQDLASPIVAILGVGYVGQHLAEVFGEECSVLAYDISQSRLDDIHAAGTFEHLPSIKLTSNASDLASATHYLVSVPTILRDDKSLDTTHIESALATVASVCRRGSVVVIESSVAVGMTRRLLQTLQAKGVLGGMSPERIDPGRTVPALETVPKIVSGLTEESLAEIEKLYAKAFDNLVKVTSPEVAEMTKLYENCQRMINIAYANEMADAAYSIGIDPYEVAAAAATKPYGFTPFTPGLGVGGACIPCNPAYLFSTLNFPLLRQASESMWSRPAKIARDIVQEDKPKPTPSRILVVGMGFKPGQSMLVHSPGLSFAREAARLGADVAWVDPLVKQEQISDLRRWNGLGQDWTVEALERNFDIIIVSLKQIQLDYSVLVTLQNRGKVQLDWRIDQSKLF